MSKKTCFPKKHVDALLILLLSLHAFLMNGYYLSRSNNTVDTYISQIRALVDPTLFENSLYVQAVNRTNLRIGFFYDLVPLIFRYFDFETFALLQAFVSIFAMLAGIFALTNLLFGNRYAAYISALLYTAYLNNWTLGSPAPYLNYFHHGLPYTYPLIVWSMVFFYQKRYPLALFLAGISWGFHSMNTAFLLPAYFLYWLCNMHEFKKSILIKSMLAFLLPSLPFIIRSVSHLGTISASGQLWLKGIDWVMWFTCLPQTWLVRARPVVAGSVLFFILVALCYTQIRNLAIRRWLAFFGISVAIQCFIGTVFADIIPIPFIIKLSLWRSTTIYLFLALPCIGYGLVQAWGPSILRRLLVITIIVQLTGYIDSLKLYYLLFSLLPLAWIFYEKTWPNYLPFIRRKLWPIIVCSFTLLICLQAILDRKSGETTIVFFAAALLLLLAERWMRSRAAPFKPMLIAAVFIILFDAGILFMRGGPEIYYHGYIKGRIDPWTDIQMFAEQNSQKNDLFIVPPYKNGFPLCSRRATLGDWAEGTTLVYLDNRFVEEWFERMRDLGWTESHNAKTGFNNLSTEDITRVALKYNAQFVVTEKPKQFNLPMAYENSLFSLYRIPDCNNQ